MQEGTSGEKQKGGSQYVWVTSLGKKTVQERVSLFRVAVPEQSSPGEH